MDLGQASLEIKRKEIQTWIDRGLFPYTKRYLGSLRNHFSTIGVNGLNEAIRNFTNNAETIATPWGQEFAKEVLDFMRNKLKTYQEETGNLYNLEATPAEGTTYRFAKEDKKRFPEILQAGTVEAPYTRTLLNCRWAIRTMSLKHWNSKTSFKPAIRAERFSTVIWGSASAHRMPVQNSFEPSSQISVCLTSRLLQPSAFVRSTGI